MKDNSKYIPSEIEEKWQKVWEEKGIYQPDLKSAKRPYYNLMMFPYPSAEGLHVGNMYAFTGADINGRFWRMKGFDVFEPIGLDGFGIHSENYAIKIGKHPSVQAKISEKNFYRQLHAIGNGFAWKNKVETYDPDYYRWTQWIFVQMFKHGFAYRRKSPVNYCPSCKTVLADEQVIDGGCERCNSLVEKRDLEQWYFAITKYADKLLKNLDTLAWTNKVKIGQRNWIGKKEGINITYDIDGTNDKVTVFTTAPVNFGMTFLVLSPEHEMTQEIINGEAGVPEKNRVEVEKYVKVAKEKSEMERIAEGREKTGVFTGLYAINSINGKKVPVWVTDFVLGHVGTGAVQGCPGHDLKDFQFAQKFGLPITRVIVGKDGDTSPIEREEQVIEKGMKGHFVNSEFLNGLEFEEGLQKTMDYFVEKGCGKRVTTYHLRDWLISRQRYWGPPIPMIYCKKCHWQPVPEADLPVELPYVENYRPTGTGEAPLAQLKEWVSVACPECGEAARRETDVSDTFLDSSWYHMRYPSVKIDAGDAREGLPNEASQGSSNKYNTFNTGGLKRSLGNPSGRTREGLPWDPAITKKWLPVTQYIGGAEHTVLHLLYARFVAMVFKDLGKIDFEEPYTRFYAHGLIIAEGAKMSKSHGNIVIPDAYIAKYGADTLRTYLMFLGPFDAGGDFRDTGIAGMYRFLNRVWRLANDFLNSNAGATGEEKFCGETMLFEHAHRVLSPEQSRGASLGGAEKSHSRPQQNSNKRQDPQSFMHRTIKEVTEDMENLRYNTAIAHIMEYVNHLTDNKEQITKSNIEALLLLLAPFAPHMTEELWQKLSRSILETGGTSEGHASDRTRYTSIHLHPWPVYDPKYLEEDITSRVVQVNGKVRDVLEINLSDTIKVGERLFVEVQAKKSERVQKYLKGKKIHKTIFVPGKLINFVV